MYETGPVFLLMGKRISSNFFLVVETSFSSLDGENKLKQLANQVLLAALSRK